jgi:hypothetical protein
MEISFGSVDSHSIRFTIPETGLPMDDKCVKQDIGQTQGWTGFTNDVEAYLY